MKKKTLLAGSLLFFVAISSARAAGPDFGNIANDLLIGVKRLWVPVVLIVFIVTALFNIGDVMGEHKNYQSFFKKIGMFVGAVAVTMAVIAWLAAQTI